jgi:hypothetical protein
MEEVVERQIGEELHICKKCGYDRGFHVSFQRRGDHYDILLICPNCGQRYGIGWKVTLAGSPA